MFTNNYIKFQKARFIADYYNDTVKLTAADNVQVTASASQLWIADIGGWLLKPNCKTISAYKDNIYIYNYSQSISGVYFGKGTTAPTKSDYKLEQPITSGLSITAPSSVIWVNNGNGTYTAIADYIVRNTTSNSISISEIGVFTPVTEETTEAANQGMFIYNVLMERTVLENPITIEAGESKLVSYRITFNQQMS